MIVGTAGHVDHGKSTLVEALTGREMDRAPEAKRRGMTLDLGFAPLLLPSGHLVELIDVPGHEDFLRTMIAGASGIDAALLVVAADEGVMPQTEEHLRVLELLGVPYGVAVLSRIDLVNAEWLELVRADLVRRLATSSVEFAAPVAVAAREGQGLDALRAALERIVPRVVRPAADDLFRLPVDRVIAVPGIGTVVAGTCWSGSISAGAEVRIGPGSKVARVRSVQSQSHAIPIATPGRRIALALAGAARREVRRGMTVVSRAADWPATRAFDAGVELACPPTRSRLRVRVHLGTDDVMGWARPTGPDGHTRVTLDRPVLARGLDRFILRDAGGRVVGGGRVLDPLPERPRGVAPGAGAAPIERLSALVARRRRGAPVEQLPVLTGRSPAEVGRALRAASDVQRIGARAVAVATVDAAADAITATLDAFHRAHPAERGMPLETLRGAGGIDRDVSEAALVALRGDGRVAVEEGLARRSDFRPRAAADDGVVRELVARIAAAGLAPPTLAELASASGRPDAPALLRVAARSGDIELVERDRYFARTALSNFLTALAEVAVAGEVSIGPLRDRLGVSRKYLIPLLEWADRQGHTVRHGDTRRIRAGRPERVK